MTRPLLVLSGFLFLFGCSQAPDREPVRNDAAIDTRVDTGHANDGRVDSRTTSDASTATDRGLNDSGDAATRDTNACELGTDTNCSFCGDACLQGYECLGGRCRNL